MADAVLFINMTDSRCGHCGKGAFPDELVHDTLAKGYGYRWSGLAPLSGCGATFTAVASDYVGIDHAVRARRPDLPFIPTLEVTR